MNQLLILTLFICSLLAGCMSSYTRTVNPDGSVSESNWSNCYPAGNVGPWVGAGSPWNYSNNNWYYNGTLWYYFGSFGWAPSYTYKTTYIQRPAQYYQNPKINYCHQSHSSINQPARPQQLHLLHSYPRVSSPTRTSGRTRSSGSPYKGR